MFTLQGEYSVFVAFLFLIPFSEAATGDDLQQNVFLEISQNSQENICAIKKRPWHICFPVNFAKFLRTPFLQNTCEFVLIKIFIVFQELTLQMLFLVFLRTVMTILWKSEISIAMVTVFWKHVDLFVVTRFIQLGF